MDSNLLLNRYVVQESLGSGSGGTVNLAWDTRIQRNVAIKRIPLPQNSNQAMAPGLEEARTAAQLHDSRIVNVYDFEIEGNEALLIMEFVDGMSLGTLMDRIPRKLDLDEIASVVQNVGKALQHAHQHHVLHLDVKPDNILINTSGQSKVTDFGIGKLASSRFVPAPNMQMPMQASSATGMYGAAVGGTIGYMPPEQIEGQNVTAKTDQWAFAVLIYELLVGENPFIASTFEQSLFELQNANIVVPSAANQNLSEEVDDILFRAMSLNPEDRYPSVAQFVSAIMPCLGEPKKGKTRLAKLTETLQDSITLGSPQDRMAVLRKLSLGSPADNAQDTEYIEDELEETVATNGKWYRDRGNSARYDSTNSDPASSEFENDPRAHLSHAADESYDECLPAKELPQIKNCISKRAAKVITRVVGGIACAIITFIGMCGLACIDEQASFDFLQNGPAALFLTSNFALPTITIIAVCAIAAVGALWPRFGSFAALIVLGVGTIASGYMANGVVILATSAIWWAFVGRLSNEASNCCLLAPCLGIISLAYMQPILCGWCLDLKKAILTSIMGVVLMVTLFPITGGGDIFACTLQFAPHNTANDLAASSVYGKTWVWINAVGWIASTVVMWLLAKHGNKLLSLMGIALATAIIVVSRGLGAMTGGIVGQTFSPVAVAALALPLVAMAFVIWMCDDA